MMISMAKYVKIEDDDIIEIEGEQYCWNCGYFVAPGGCSNIFGVTTPFNWCEHWSKTDDEYLDENKDKIDECCKENRIKRIEDNKGLIEVYKKDLDKSINKILELMSME